MQPQWKYIGTIGDCDPITYGGGFVYVDVLGNYSPEIAWFEPETDDKSWQEHGDQIPVVISRILIEKDSTEEWWYRDLDVLSRVIGKPLEELQQMANSNCTMEKALLYMDLLCFFGSYQFDQEPQVISEKTAYQKYAKEMEETTQNAR